MSWTKLRVRVYHHSPQEPTPQYSGVVSCPADCRRLIDSMGVLQFGSSMSTRVAPGIKIIRLSLKQKTYFA